MDNASRLSSRWVYLLAAGFLLGAVLLRSLLVYSGSRFFPLVAGLLSAWLILAGTEFLITRRWKGYFPVFLLTQTLLVFVLMRVDDRADFFATLLLVMTMQVMARANPRAGAAWIAFCAVFMAAALWQNLGAEALALSIVFTAANLVFGLFILALRRARDARLRNEELAEKLAIANKELAASALRREELALARERNRLARELHDSVTQTVFSMSLAAQSAGIMLTRDTTNLPGQLKRISSLSGSALSEMKLLVTELKPRETGGGLAAALRRYAAEHTFPGDLKVNIAVEGAGIISSPEEETLFRIAREGLNNTAKHARAAEATVRLHLLEPFSMEIEDKGQGFDVHARPARGMGLVNMQEQAEEIGWKLDISSAVGKGTLVRVIKNSLSGG